MKHIQPCFCTGCVEARDCGAGEDEPDYDEWAKAFPEKFPPQEVVVEPASHGESKPEEASCLSVDETSQLVEKRPDSVN